MALGTTLAETLATFAATRHDALVVICSEILDALI